MPKNKNTETHISIPLESMSEKVKSVIMAYAEDLKTSPGLAIKELVSEVVKKGFLSMPEFARTHCEDRKLSLAAQKNPSFDQDKYLLLSPGSYDCLLIDKKLLIEGELVVHPKQPEAIHIVEDGIIYSYAVLHTMKDGRKLIVSYFKYATNCFMGTHTPAPTP